MLSLVCRPDSQGSTPQEAGTSAPGQWLVFEVTDTGCGIAKEGLHALFNDFVQVGSHVRRSHMPLLLIKVHAVASAWGACWCHCWCASSMLRKVWRAQAQLREILRKCIGCFEGCVIAGHACEGGDEAVWCGAGDRG